MSYGQPISLAPGDLGSGRVLVPYRLNGHDRTFVLDTGASFSHVNLDEHTSKLARTGSLTKRGAGGVAKEGDWVDAASVEIGTLLLSGVRLGRFLDAGRDNLGNDVLLGKLIELRFSDLMLMFHDKVPEYPGGVPIELLPTRQLRFSAQLGGIPVAALFDTGAELNSIDSRFVATHRELFEFIQTVEDGSDITGAPMKMELYRSTELMIGGQRLALGCMLVFDFAPLRPHIGADTPIILGYNSIIQRDWLIDLAQLRLSFKAPTT